MVYDRSAGDFIKKIGISASLIDAFLKKDMSAEQIQTMSDKVLPYLQAMGFIFEPGKYTPDNCYKAGEDAQVGLFVKDTEGARHFELFFSRRSFKSDKPVLHTFSISLASNYYIIMHDTMDERVEIYSSYPEIIGKYLYPVAMLFFPENASSLAISQAKCSSRSALNQMP